MGERGELGEWHLGRQVTTVKGADEYHCNDSKQ